MPGFAFYFVNTSLVVSSVIMALVFLFLPMSSKEGLRNYRTSLRFLALAYFSLSALTAMDLKSGSNSTEFSIVLTAISLQVLLFAFALITLFNNHFASKKYILKHLWPNLFFIILSFVFGHIWGNPPMQNINNYIQNYTHPTAVFNLLFLLFCIVQLLYFTFLFVSQVKKYELRLDNYYADTYRLHLTWVRYCFFGAVAFCLLIIASELFYSPIFALVVTGVNSVFYTVFGLCYMQYPLTFIKLEPVVNEEGLEIIEESKKNTRNTSWEKLRATIIADKYYIRSDVNIEEMARYLGIGRTSLSSYINKNEGMNFHAWISTLRIEEAKQIIIANPNYTITQVAETVGYSEASHFSRQFKQITQQSPLMWKQAQMPQNQR